MDEILHIIAQNLRLNELYHAETPKFTFGVKLCACMQSLHIVYIAPCALCETHFIQS